MPALPSSRQWIQHRSIFVAESRDCVPTIVVNSFFLPFAWMCVLLRMWTRASIKKVFGWDDWTMLLAAAFFTVYCVSVIEISTRVSGGPTQKSISSHDLTIVVTLLNISEEFYLLTVMVLKISLGIFFLRLAMKPWQRYVIYAAVGISSIFSIAMFFFAVFQCGVYTTATEFILRRFEGRCVSDAAALGMTYTHAAITTLTDWTFLILPGAILKQSLMNKPDKLTITAVLMFASISGIASIIRFRFIDRLAVPKLDFFANAKNIAIWSCVEPGIGIIAGSLITLRPLLRLCMDWQRAPAINYGNAAKRPSQGPRLNFMAPFRPWDREKISINNENSTTYSSYDAKDSSLQAPSSAVTKSTIDFPCQNPEIRSGIETQMSSSVPPPPPPPPKDKRYQKKSKNSAPDTEYIGAIQSPRDLRTLNSGLPLRIFATSLATLHSTDSF